MFRKLRVKLIKLLAHNDIIACIGVEFDSRKGIIIRNNNKEAIVKDCIINMNHEGEWITWIK